MTYAYLIRYKVHPLLHDDSIWSYARGNSLLYAVAIISQEEQFSAKVAENKRL